MAIPMSEAVDVDLISDRYKECYGVRPHSLSLEEQEAWYRAHFTTDVEPTTVTWMSGVTEQVFMTRCGCEGDEPFD